MCDAAALEGRLERRARQEVARGAADCHTLHLDHTGRSVRRLTLNRRKCHCCSDSGMKTMQEGGVYCLKKLH